jgi:hypothetical protein
MRTTINIVSIWILPSQRKLVDLSREESPQLPQKPHVKEGEGEYLFTSAHFQILFVDSSMRQSRVTHAEKPSKGFQVYRGFKFLLGVTLIVGNARRRWNARSKWESVHIGTDVGPHCDQSGNHNRRSCISKGEI